MRIRPTWRSVLIGTLLFAILMIIMRLITDGIPHDREGYLKLIIPSIVSGLIFSFIFGFLMDRFVSSKGVAESSKLTKELEPGENIITETGANHFINREGVGGKLFLTDRQIIFKSHKYNIQPHSLSIPFADIKEIRSVKTLGMINNGLSITAAGDKKEKFVVADRNIFLDALPASLQGLRIR